MTLDVYLSIFSLMFVSLGVNFLALKLRIPYTVLLVIVGSLLVPLSKVELFSFLNSFQLTPELLFFVFLPILIFESAYNIKFRNVKENKIAISMLAILGLSVSTFFIGYVGHWVFLLLGFEIPLLVTLLFGALISATDPVAVLALFKEYGAPHRLTLIFEGESLFNDGTAFAIFLVLLEIFANGYNGYTTLLHGFISFCFMLLGGAIFGLFMGFIFSKLIERVRGHENLEITLTLLVAHLTFLLAELISSKLILNGHSFHLSSIIATLVSSMVIGNYGRYKMSSAVEDYMDKFWGYFAFLANSLVFILMGFLFTSLTISFKITLLPILMMILVVVIARGVSIYLAIGIANQFKSEESIPVNWQHLLAWGSLRGSLAVIMVLLIPDNIALPDWRYEFSIKEFLIAITIGSIYFSLLIKAMTMGKVVHWLKIDKMLPYEQVGYYKSKALVYSDISHRIQKLYAQHHISEQQYKKFSQYYHDHYQKICKQCNKLDLNTSHVIENMLRIYTLAIQKKELKLLFQHDEISESVYKKNLTILETQTERIEQDKDKLSSLNLYLTTWAGIFNNFVRRLLFMSAKKNDGRELYLYYHTQYQIISKVLEELDQLNNSRLNEVFDDQKALDNVIAIYQKLIKETEVSMQNEIKSNKKLLDYLNEQSAISLLQTVQNNTLNDLYEKDIITRKLLVLLNKELNRW